MKETKIKNPFRTKAIYRLLITVVTKEASSFEISVIPVFHPLIAYNYYETIYFTFDIRDF